MKQLLIICLALGWGAAPALATTMYVTDPTEINIRAGKGTDYKIVATLASGMPVDVVETGRDWTRVQLDSGKTGWVVSRYLTSEKPAAVELGGLKAAADQMSREINELKIENDMLTKENQELSEQVNALDTERTDLRAAYDKLKRESADYLKLKGEYDRLSRQDTEQHQKIASLEQKTADADISKAIKWFLSGAGVLLTGMVIGAGMKRKRSSLY